MTLLLDKLNFLLVLGIQLCQIVYAPLWEKHFFLYRAAPFFEGA